MLVSGFEPLTNRYGMNWERMDIEDAISILLALSVAVSELYERGESTSLLETALNMGCAPSEYVSEELRRLDDELDVEHLLQGISAIARLIPPEEIEDAYEATRQEAA